jgi:hypothetical protein
LDGAVVAEPPERFAGCQSDTPRRVAQAIDQRFGCAPVSQEAQDFARGLSQAADGVLQEEHQWFYGDRRTEAHQPFPGRTARLGARRGQWLQQGREKVGARTRATAVHLGQRLRGSLQCGASLIRQRAFSQSLERLAGGLAGVRARQATEQPLHGAGVSQFPQRLAGRAADAGGWIVQASDQQPRGWRTPVLAQFHASRPALAPAPVLNPRGRQRS